MISYSWVAQKMFLMEVTSYRAITPSKEANGAPTEGGKRQNPSRGSSLQHGSRCIAGAGTPPAMNGEYCTCWPADFENFRMEFQGLGFLPVKILENDPGITWVPPT